MNATARLLFFSFCASSNLAVAATDSLWVEGENPTKQDVTRHPWWYDKVKTDVLSEGAWLSHFDDKKEGSAEYAFSLDTADTYALWMRANPVASALSYQMDAGAWTEVSFKDARGQQNIAADNKPDLRFIAWVKAGDLKLSAGAHVLRIKFHSKSSHHGALDCFCLTRIPFVPSGKVKPGADTAPAGPDTWFPLLVDEDPMRPGSVIDMSGLNEVPAGKFGPVVAKGDKLVFSGNGQEVKFWGCGANQEQSKWSRAQNLRRIAYLRKFGINAVRQHTLFDEVATEGKIDPAKLAEYDWWFSELKKAGIYTQWSVFYHFPISPADGYPLFEELEPMNGKSGLRDSYGLITMSPELWEIRTKVLLELLNHKNPHTGLRYAEDPALIAVEYQNEDSIFFWNPLGELANPKPKKWQRHAQRLRQKFAAWAKQKYRDDNALKAAWGKLAGGESVDTELGLMGPWEIDGGGIRGRFAGQTRRAGDQIRFLVEMQQALYTACEKAIRSTGFKAQTITTNWLGGSNLLDQANIFTDLIATTIDRHNYAGGGAGGHGITEGPIYADSHLGKPGQDLFAIGLKQVENKPFCMSEWTMCPPNRWKLECAPIFAFYGMALQGWDASFHFVQSGNRLGDGWPDMRSYATDTPHYMGQFPALAFALRKGHFKEAPILAARRTAPDALFDGKLAWKQDFYNGHELIRAPGGTPLEIFALGRVTVGFGAEPSSLANLDELWDKNAKTLRAATDELLWDYGKRRILVQSAKTQGIIGHASGETISLPGVKVSLTTEFVSLLFTPLDDQPLVQSRRILITALAQDKQSGAKYSDDGTQLLAVGTAPLLLEPVIATLQFVGAKPAKVTPLDPYGYPTTKNVPITADGSVKLDGSFQAYYYEVTR